MAKKVKVLTDKYKSTTKIYPKVIMGSLSPEVKEYIESQGEQEEKRGDITAKLYIDKWGDYGVASVLETKKDATHFAECRVYGNKVNGEDIYGAELTYRNGDILDNIRIDKDGITLGSYKDININTYGTSKLYINGIEYTGGGKKLYQHNISINNMSDRFRFLINITIINDSNTPINTIQLLNKYLFDNNFVSQNDRLMCNGFEIDTNNTTRLNIINSVYCDGTASQTLLQCTYYYADNKSLNIATTGLSVNSPSVVDHIVEL